jgi:hypothetical protein
VDAEGAEVVVDQLDQLNGRFPGRYVPCDLLVAYARARKRFYPVAGRPLT